MDRIRVLVADDEAGMRMGVSRVLRDYAVALPEVDDEVGFTVEGVETGEEVLERTRTNPPGILLLDHKLPGISGLDVLDRLVEMDLEMLTVMITAYATLETAVSATKRGAYDFLAKPFTPDELKNTIRKTAGRLMLARQARKLAQEKRRVRFEFISILAHELKTPLAAVEGFLRILRDAKPGDDPKTFTHMIDRCVVRTEQMRKMVFDLLDMTRIESGQKKRDLIELDVCQVARQAIAACAPEAEPRNIRVELHAPDSATMLADEEELRIIFGNLLSNALKYNRDGGRVDVSVRAAEDTLVIAVEDTGIGMTEEEAKTLFREFARIKNEKTRMIHGSGLGLSIVRKLVQLYGGDVSVTSEPDVGSVFTVVLKRESGKT